MKKKYIKRTKMKALHTHTFKVKNNNLTETITRNYFFTL